MCSHDPPESCKESKGLSFFRSTLKQRQMESPRQERLNAFALWPAGHLFFAQVLVAILLSAWPAARTFAADRPDNDRSVSSTAVPSSGTTPGPSFSMQNRALQPSNVNASARGLPAQSDKRCVLLRKRYARSEACFARYRMKNGGLRPGAFKHCKQMKDPSSDCEPPTVAQ
jgi:hypothetical protein